MDFEQFQVFCRAGWKPLRFFLDKDSFVLEKLEVLADNEIYCFYTTHSSSIPLDSGLNWFKLCQTRSIKWRGRHAITDFFTFSDMKPCLSDKRNSVPLSEFLKNSFWYPGQNFRSIHSSTNSNKCSVLSCGSKFWNTPLNHAATRWHSLIVERFRPCLSSCFRSIVAVWPPFLT